MLRARRCKSPSLTLINCRKRPHSRWAYGMRRADKNSPFLAKSTRDLQETRALASIHHRCLSLKIKLRSLSKSSRLLRRLMIPGHYRAVTFLMNLLTQRWLPFTRRVETLKRIPLHGATRRALSDRIRKLSIINWAPKDWKTQKARKFCQKNNLMGKWVFPESKRRQWNRAIWRGPIKWGFRSWTTPSSLKKRNRQINHCLLLSS